MGVLDKGITVLRHFPLEFFVLDLVEAGCPLPHRRQPFLGESLRLANVPDFGNFRLMHVFICIGQSLKLKGGDHSRLVSIECRDVDVRHNPIHIDRGT